MEGLPEPRWLADEGPDMAVAVSTRCRLARNLTGVPFPWRASDLQRRAVADAVGDAARRAGGDVGRARVISAERLRPDDLVDLVDRRYASADWARGGSHRHVLVLPDGSGSLLVNEEDHLRLQVILPGLQVESARERAESVAQGLAEHLEFAHDPRLGFLTASPANVGIAMRVGVLLHLPALAVSEALPEALQAAEDVGCSVRGLHGEGTAGTGWLVQVSNMRALGVSPREAASRVDAAARHLVDAESSARSGLYGAEPGRTGLREAAAGAWRRLFDEEHQPADLLLLIGVLRLALAEGVLRGDLRQASGWIAVAGAAAAQEPGDQPGDRYEAVSRSAALRQRLRQLAGASGTSGPGRAE